MEDVQQTVAIEISLNLKKCTYSAELVEHWLVLARDVEPR